MKLIDILEGITFRCVKGDCNVEINNIVYDSRKAVTGDVFVCLIGAELDGHMYIEEAIAKGVKTFVIERDIDIDAPVTVIKVSDARLALSYMSATLFGYPAKELTMIGITGTKGKTTTAFMIKEILERAGKKVGMIGTVGAFINGTHMETKNTTPESYELHRFFRQMVDEKCEYAIMEVSSQALKSNRTAGIEYEYGIFTNLSSDHIGGAEHADFEEYQYCKSLLFKQCKHGIFNVDDDHVTAMTKGATCDVYTYGFDKSAMLTGDDVSYLVEPGFIGISLSTHGLVEAGFKINTPGKFSAYNAMAAILTTQLLNIPVPFMKEGLNEIAVRGRVEPVKVSEDFNLMIDYAHNAMSMESVLTTMKDYQPRRIVSLFGCGGNRSKQRRYEMGEISGKFADLSIITADNSRFEEIHDIIQDILIGMEKTDGKYIVIPDRKEAIRYSIEHALPGDVVLLLGKGHEDYQEIKGVQYPFDERTVINDILKDIQDKVEK